MALGLALMLTARLSSGSTGLNLSVRWHHGTAYFNPPTYSISFNHSQPTTSSKQHIRIVNMVKAKMPQYTDDGLDEDESSEPESSSSEEEYGPQKASVLMPPPKIRRPTTGVMTRRPLRHATTTQIIPKYDGYAFNSKSQIRLLELKLSSTGQPVWTFTRPITIIANHGHEAEAACQFAAVSYEWGDSQCVEPFTVCGKEVRLRRNLVDFLHAVPGLRDKQNLPAVFWIDSLCIDQDNIEEKMDQIQLLRNIYSSATCVLSWLGPIRDGSNLAMKYLRGVDLEAEDSVTTLLNRRYWTRLWMVQEVVLGGKWYVACGSDIIDGGYLDRRLRMPTNLRATRHTSAWLGSKGYKLISERLRFENSGPLPLLDLMLRFFELEAEVRVDNIRALLALSKPDTIGRLHDLLAYLVDASGDILRTKTLISDICVEMVQLNQLETTWNTQIPREDLIKFLSSLLDIDITKKDLCMLAERLQCSRMIIIPGLPLMPPKFVASGEATFSPDSSLAKRDRDGEISVHDDRAMLQSLRGVESDMRYMPLYLTQPSIKRGKLTIRTIGIASDPNPYYKNRDEEEK
jgi:hypothetical protein